MKYLFRLSHPSGKCEGLESFHPTTPGMAAVKSVINILKTKTQDFFNKHLKTYLVYLTVFMLMSNNKKD